MLDRLIGLRALTAAETFAGMIDGSWLQEFAASDRSIPDLEKLRADLDKLTQKRYLFRVEVVGYAGANEMQHLISVPTDRSPDYHPPDHSIVRRTEDYTARSPGFGVVQLSSGAYMGGWAPVMHQGRQVGLVLVAVDAEDTQETLDTIDLAIGLTMIVVILMSGLMAYKFSSTFEKTAVTDGLMGIYNHKYFKQRLEQEVHKAARYGQQTSLVLLDIDFFKRVNDTYGHATGDITLKSLAKWVSESTRTSDIVCRYGGEEIAIILPHTGVAGAQEFAERLRLKISQQVVKDPGEKAEFRVTVSVGVAQWEKGVNMIDLIKRTDAALYHSKNTGRNRVTIYQDDILKPPADPQPKKQAR